ncbi:hypothetical protein VP01_777g1 [Puccinia sorghi]|uniref:Uncharacterized protein n=1 Tax=Puccinia sorghi TaxID=27349 RepID=A0A0L6UDD4_9BASI|nr:hypothetical protein VP01_777g1 [Puccinia sorghi]
MCLLLATPPPTTQLVEQLPECHCCWNRLGERLTLENILLVPTLTQSLISILQLFKQEILTTRATNKGAILIDKKFSLLGSLKNNFLALHSSHIDVISICYQSSPEKPNWNAQLGHPNHHF